MLVMERFKELSLSSGKTVTVTVDGLGRGGGAGTTGAVGGRTRLPGVGMVAAVGRGCPGFCCFDTPSGCRGSFGSFDSAGAPRSSGHGYLKTWR